MDTVPVTVPEVVPDVKPGNQAELIATHLATDRASEYFPIGNGKHVKVCRYRKKPYVNIREYATTTDGHLYATKRGILLRPEEWKQLKKCYKDVEQELKSSV